MVLSMTGYGKAEKKNKNFIFSVEVKSLNSRYFDVSSKIPPLAYSYEHELVSLIQSHCERGKFFLNVKVKNNFKNKKKLLLNPEKLNSYINLIKDVQKKTKRTDSVSMDYLLNIPDLIDEEESSIQDDPLNKKALLLAVNLAIKKLNEFRKSEGVNLKKDLLQKINIISKLIDKVSSLNKKTVKSELILYKKKLKNIVVDLNQNSVRLDSDRLYQEIAILIEKKDINEELVRFKSHIKLFNKTLNGRTNSGKKINFILQEMVREINTIGSKIDSLSINHLIVDIKYNIEKIREQVQNIL